jgi:hypothetical protein
VQRAVSAKLCLATGEDNPEKTIRFIDGGTTNLSPAGILPERLSTTVATQYPAMPAAKLSLQARMTPQD